MVTTFKNTLVFPSRIAIVLHLFCCFTVLVLAKSADAQNDAANVGEAVELIHTFRDRAANIRAVTFSDSDKYVVWGGSDRIVHRHQLATKIAENGVLRCQDLIDKLDDESFEVRQQAHVELRKYGAEITDLLETCVGDDKVSREARFRAQVILDSLQHPFGRGHQRDIRDLASARSKPIFASAGHDGVVFLWHPNQSLPACKIQAHNDGAWSVAFSPDGNTLATGGGDHLIHLWDPTEAKQQRTMVGHANSVHDLAFSPDGTTLASAGSFDKTVRIWKPSTGKQLHVLEMAREPLRIAFHPNGELLAAAGYGSTITVWSTNDWSVQQQLETNFESIRCLQYSPNGRWLAAGGNGETLFLLPVDESTKGSPVGGSKRTKTDTRSKIAVTGHSHSTLSVAFSADSKQIATGDTTGSLRLWRLK